MVVVVHFHRSRTFRSGVGGLFLGQDSDVIVVRGLEESFDDKLSEYTYVSLQLCKLCRDLSLFKRSTSQI